MRNAVAAVLLLSAGVVSAQDRVADREAKVRAYLERGKAYKAIAQCDAMLGRDPQPLFLALRAEAYNRLGEHAKAERDARAAVRAFPNDAAAYLQLGTAEQGMGLKDSAVVHLRRSAALRASSEARIRLASVLRAQGEARAALAELEIALQELPEGDRRHQAHHRGEPHRKTSLKGLAKPWQMAYLTSSTAMQLLARGRARK